MLSTRIPSYILLLLISTLAFSWTWLLAKNISYRDPGSRFFDPTRAYEQRYSLQRQSEANKYEQTVKDWLPNVDRAHKGGTIDRWPLGTRRTGEHPAVCATFITTARKIGVQYIDGAIASALHGLTPTERKMLDLRIYFSNLNVSEHSAWGSWIANVTDAQFTPQDIATPDLLARMQRLADANDFHSKSGLDYSLALQHCLDNSTAPYIAIFEGDVQLADSWFIRLLHGLQDAQILIGKKRWLFMRLFNEERASGFSSKHPLGNNAPLIILFTNLLITLILWNSRRLAQKLDSRRLDFVSRNFILGLTCFTIPAFVILFFQTGKATVLPPAPGLRVENFGCCTQGTVFPRQEVQGLIDVLRRRAEEENYDVIMSEYSWKGKNGTEEGENLDGGWLDHLALYPMMVQHMGFESVISPERDGDKQIWSMAYEDLDWERLGREHEGMVRSMFGDNAWVDNRP